MFLFLSPEGVLIMNFTFDVTELTEAILPSPTGVTYYELLLIDFYKAVHAEMLFPSPTGVTYYE